MPVVGWKTRQRRSPCAVTFAESGLGQGLHESEQEFKTSPACLLPGAVISKCNRAMSRAGRRIDIYMGPQENPPIHRQLVPAGKRVRCELDVTVDKKPALGAEGYVATIWVVE